MHLQNNIKSCSIYFKIMASLCLMILIPIVGLTIYHYVHQRHYSAQTEVEKLKFYSMSLSSEIDNLMSGHLVLVRALALDPQLKELTRLHPFDNQKVEPIQDWLEQQTPIAPEIESFFVLNRAGNCIASTEQSFITKNYAVRPYFKDGMAGRIHVSDWSVGLTTRKPGVFFAAPITKSDQIVGVVILKIGISKILEILQRSQDASLNIRLVNRMGIVLATNKPPEKVYHSLSRLSFKEKEQLDTSQQFADVQIQPMNLSTLKSAHERILQQGGTETSEFEVNGLNKVAALTKLKSQQWSIIISKPLDVIYSDSKIILISALIIASILLIVTVFLGIFIAKQITRPISDLLSVINLFGSGDLNARATVETHDEIGALAKTFNAMAKTIHEQTDNLEQKVKERTADLELAYDKIRTLSNTDALTGCYNRRYMEEVLNKELLRANKENLYVSVTICDIDFFKKVNDTYGHAAGDLVLAEFAGIVKEVIRKGDDQLFRYGGEEFVIVFPDTPIDKARIIVERIRIAVEKRLFVWTDQTIKITASFGVTSVTPSVAKEVSVESFISKADALLYSAKNDGRNLTKAEVLEYT
jgi:diguanylate cyclase (GGDEF)-like protein